MYIHIYTIYIFRKMIRFTGYNLYIFYIKNMFFIKIFNIGFCLISASCTSRKDQYQARIQGGRAPVPPPPSWSSQGGVRGWGTIWLNNCQNSLKTRLNYIKITLKVDFYKRNLALTLIEFFRGGHSGPGLFKTP